MNKQDIKNQFILYKCDTCPFKKECDALYSHIRKYTTDTINLCNAILGFN